MLRLLIGVICINFVLFAKPVNNQKAIETATKFLSAKSLQNRTINSVNIYQKNNIDIFYYINFEPAGFVLIAADDRIKPLLAYSFDKKFEINNSLSSLNWLLDMYSSSIISQINNSEVQTLDVKENWENFEEEQGYSSTRQVDPLIEAEFNQAPPGWIDLLDPFDWIGWDWNEECPEDDDGPGGHAVVGCVSVAMSQVMHYWQFPEYGKDSHEYNADEYGDLYVDFGNTYYEFQNMEETSSDHQNQVLLYHAGVSVDMNYGPDVSGAWVCDNLWSDNASESALKDFFRYDESLHCIEPDDFADGEEYQNMLINELENGRPIIYVGSDIEAWSGHAWNIDGYTGEQDGDILFHCNWGWGGSNNGYFYLDDLSPQFLGNNFVDNQRALIGIQPQTGCLDESAFNYTADPVLACEDCCDYCQNDGLLDISIISDENPEDTNWELWYKGIYVNSYQYMYPTLVGTGDIIGDQLCIRDEGMYEFIIYDEQGDGLCCTSFDEGSYEVNLNEELVASGDVFGYSESTLFAWIDSDGDLVIDSIDECQGFNDNIDTDSDGVADGCDICPNDANNDEDNDGLCYGDDNCPFDYYNDIDGDNICGDIDNCPDLANGSQSNFDDDSEGNMCDSDDDNDSVPDTFDNNPYNQFVCLDADYDNCDDCSIIGQPDSANDGYDFDADGICDTGDVDDDNDGILDSEDCSPLDPSVGQFFDCCGSICGDNSTCDNCCGIPFNDDCTSDCYEDILTGECCLIEVVDECGLCYGDGSSCNCVPGDSNLDGFINVQDVVLIVNDILDPNIELDECSDINSDGLITVQDVVLIINYILDNNGYGF